MTKYTLPDISDPAASDHFRKTAERLQEKAKAKDTAPDAPAPAPPALT